MLSRLFILAALLLSFQPFQPEAHAQDSTEAMQPPATEEEAAAETIADVLESEGNFTTLLAALQDTGLMAELQDGTQQFTLFAPTDEAFASLPEGTLSGMDADQLKDVLSYHLVPGNVSLSDAAAEGMVTTAQGADLTIEGDAGSATVDGAAISEADLSASNGTIHVVDAVLLPAQGDASMQEDAMEEPEEPAMPTEDAPEEPQDAPQPTEPPQR